MCWDKATCWDDDAGVPKYMNRDPPCKSQIIKLSMNETSSTRVTSSDLNRCEDHQFFTIVDNAVQERDLKLYLEITPPFSNWISYCTKNDLWETECLFEPEIIVDGYISFDTNGEWRHFDDTRLDYLGTLNPLFQNPTNRTYSSFAGTKLHSEYLEMT